MAAKPQREWSETIWTCAGIAGLLIAAGAFYLEFFKPAAAPGLTPEQRQIVDWERKGDVQHLARQARQTDDIDLAERAVIALGEIAVHGRIADVLPYLNEAAEHTAAAVRCDVARQLGEIAAAQKWAEPADALTKLAVDKDAGVRLAAMLAVGHIKAIGAVDVLLDGLLDADPDVRVAAFQSWTNLIGSCPPKTEYDPITNPSPGYVDGLRHPQWRHYMVAMRREGNR